MALTPPFRPLFFLGAESAKKESRSSKLTFAKTHPSCRVITPGNWIKLVIESNGRQIARSLKFSKVENLSYILAVPRLGFSTAIYNGILDQQRWPSDVLVPHDSEGVQYLFLAAELSQNTWNLYKSLLFYNILKKNFPLSSD
jgi:hypothetical protein